MLRRRHGNHLGVGLQVVVSIGQPAPNVVDHLEDVLVAVAAATLERKDVPAPDADIPVAVRGDDHLDDVVGVELRGTETG